MTDQPKFLPGARVQLTLTGTVRRPFLVEGRWLYPVLVNGGPESRVLLCGEQAITQEDDRLRELVAELEGSATITAEWLIRARAALGGSA